MFRGFTVTGAHRHGARGVPLSGCLPAGLFLSFIMFLTGSANALLLFTLGGMLSTLTAHMDGLVTGWGPPQRWIVGLVAASNSLISVRYIDGFRLTRPPRSLRTTST